MMLPRFARSLSSRLLSLTVGVILIAGVLVFVPGLARERRGWFERHLREAHIAALALAAAPQSAADPAARQRLLALSGSEMISFRDDGNVAVILAPRVPIRPKMTIDLRSESTFDGMEQAVAELFRVQGRQIAVIGGTVWRPNTVVELIVDESDLLTMLHDYAWRALSISLAIAGVTGGLIYMAVHSLLVRPVRRITRSIAAFRADPERSTPLDDGRVGPPGGEIAVAGRELAAMQRELRAALWRNARLAALGTAVAKVSHDVRGILSSAMLSADRLSTHADPNVRRAAETVLRSIERATELVGQTLAYTRDGPPPLERGRVPLRALIEEVVEGIPGLAVSWEIAPGLAVEGDRVALFRVFGNLLRNARDAGARRVRAGVPRRSSAASPSRWPMTGPALPEAVRTRLFRPFASSGQRGGTGLGLAIARDLTRAHGGDIELVTTGPEGTVFRLALPAHAMPEPRWKDAPEAVLF